jgi:hypothetical protein
MIIEIITTPELNANFIFKLNFNLEAEKETHDLSKLRE